LHLDLPEVGPLRAERDEMVDQLADYVLPRLLQQDAPLLAVVGGSTGAGKSTLVNSLVRERVTVSGVLRPTTRSPVLVHHPDDSEWFESATLLPELARTTRPDDDIGALHLVTSAAVPAGLAILDAPDVDSVEAGNRALASHSSLQLTCGSSSPPLPATPTRSRGASCGGPPSAAPPSRSSSIARLRSHRGSARAPGADAWLPRPEGLALSSSQRRRLTARDCCRASRAGHPGVA
jgi:hypothetical protein